MLTDFGIALAVKEAGGNRLTQTGLSLGTPQYMSPEQATGDRGIDARSDVYSLACVLYEMLAGEPPVTGASAQSMIAKLMTEKPTSLRVLRDTVPKSIDAAVTKALAKTPADRFASAGEFSRALDAKVEVETPGSSRGCREGGSSEVARAHDDHRRRSGSRRRRRGCHLCVSGASGAAPDRRRRRARTAHAAHDVGRGARARDLAGRQTARVHHQAMRRRELQVLGSGAGRWRHDEPRRSRWRHLGRTISSGAPIGGTSSSMARSTTRAGSYVMSALGGIAALSHGGSSDVLRRRRFAAHRAGIPCRLGVLDRGRLTRRHRARQYQAARSWRRRRCALVDAGHGMDPHAGDTGAARALAGDRSHRQSRRSRDQRVHVRRYRGARCGMALARR